MLHKLYLLVFDQLFVLRVVLVKSYPVGPTWLPSIMSDLPIDWLNMNSLVGEASLKFYWDV
jgi:hypothetical protein